MKIIELTCMDCGKKFQERYKGQRYHSNHHCSKECSLKYTRKISSETMAKTNKKYASDRMKKNNPMKNKESREKMSATLKAIGHKPKILGGNGRGPSIPEKLLADALGWNNEIIVRTYQKRGSGYPGCYKIDIGNEILKIGVEIDGRSHGLLKKQEQDKKKTLFLNKLGWTILRFKNKEVLENLDSCVTKVLSMTL